MFLAWPRRGSAERRRASGCSTRRPSCSPSAGIEGSSVDAIAERAERTSGAVYDHFGGKDGLLFALLEGWVDDVAAVIGAELVTATTLDERLAVALAQRHRSARRRGPLDRASSTSCGPTPPATSAAREHLARRYRAAWDGRRRGRRRVDRRRREPRPVGPAVIGVLLGLEMMRRVDPDAMTDDTGVAALRGVVTHRPQELAR